MRKRDAIIDSFHVQAKYLIYCILTEIKTVLVKSILSPDNYLSIMEHHRSTPFTGEGGGGGSTKSKPDITQCTMFLSIYSFSLNPIGR